MATVGIICEYNPFHAGHAHLLREVRGEGVCVCLMSGYFTQRGEAAILPPVSRAEMALSGGADLVLELPFPFAAASARYFASAGVRALAALGCDTLAFGSECADQNALLQTAAYLNTPAFAESAAQRTPETGDAAAHFAALGAMPGSNDILAIEYLRAILAEELPLAILPVQRVGDLYRDTQVQTAYPSATALRAMLEKGEDITPFLPAQIAPIFQKEAKRWGIADTARLGSALLARLRAGEVPAEIAECGGGLGAWLCRAGAQATDYASLCRAAATKRYTDGRIRRALLYLLCGVKREDLTAPPAYLRLLGANKRGREFLSNTRKTRTVPVVTKPADITALGDAASRQRALSQVAEGVYALCMEAPTRPDALSGIAPLIL